MTARKESPDFTQKTIEEVLIYAGYRCSAPGCYKPLRARSGRADGYSQIQQVSHIRGARYAKNNRYDPNMTDPERSSSENAIALCDIHGGLIDQDQARYTVELLKDWRKKHEERIYQEMYGTLRPGEFYLSDYTSWSNSDLQQEIKNYKILANKAFNSHLIEMAKTVLPLLFVLVLGGLLLPKFGSLSYLLSLLIVFILFLYKMSISNWNIKKAFPIVRYKQWDRFNVIQKQKIEMLEDIIISRGELTE